MRHFRGSILPIILFVAVASALSFAGVGYASVTVEKNTISAAVPDAEAHAEEPQNITIDALNKIISKVDDGVQLDQGLGSKSVATIIIIVIAFLFILLVSQGANRFENFITEKDVIREKESTLRLKTLASIVKWTGTVLVFLVAAYMLLDNFGFNMGPLLAGAGVLGIALGFGGQYLIRDILNGVFILIEGQFRINDVVKIGEHGGLVESINLRYTRLRDLEGRVIYIPNGKIETVINFTQEYAQAVLDIGVAYKENVDQVMEVLAQIAEEMRQDKHFKRLILDKLEMLGVDQFADSQVTIKCRIKTLPIKQWEVAREFRRRIKNRFDELNIEIPFPHRTIYYGTEKKQGDEVKVEAQLSSGQDPKMKKGQAGDAGE